MTVPAKDTTRSTKNTDISRPTPMSAAGSACKIVSARFANALHNLTFPNSKDKLQVFAELMFPFNFQAWGKIVTF